MLHLFTDTAKLKGTRKTTDGYLIAEVAAARTGIQQYLGSEIGRPDLEVVNVYRSADEVFRKSSMASFVGKPLTDGHPDEIVNADNWADYAKGTIGDEVARDGEKLKLTIALMDGKTIQKVEDGTNQLSVGYRAKIVWEDGVTPEGVAYQAKQTNIFVDHLAIVPAGRAGKEFRIGDNADTWGAAPITHPVKQERPMTDKTKTVVVDGIPVETTEAGAAVIDKLQTQINDLTKKLTDAGANHAAAIVAKDEKIGELAAEVKKLSDAVLNDDQIEKRVADRAALVELVHTIDSKIEIKGLTDNDLRKAAVAKKLGDDFVKDASDAEIAGAFRAITKDAKPADRLSDAFRGGITSHVLADAEKKRNDAFKELEEHQANAWKGAQ